MIGYILLIISLVPSYLLLKYIYKKDTVEKEPKKLLIKCLGVGLAIVIPAGIIEVVLGSVIDLLFGTSKLYYVITVFFGIAMVEEGMKYIALKMCTWKEKDFNYIFDAVVYSVFISLGFATLENIGYVLGSDSSLLVGIFRAISAVPSHFFYSIYMGLFYGMAKRECVKGKSDTKYKILALLVPTLIHGVYDYLIYMYEISHLYIIVWIIVLVLLYVVTFIKVKKMSLSDTPLFSVYNSEDLIKKESPNINNYNNHNTYCTKCGRPMVGIFCSHCGYKIE